ncbi:MAG TPA: hypothetical protein VND96_09530 [Candidatus Micrarchaeaceae archaeon]|nr:hypothetical protein [Candidatus Micrarchaeaceae archaeon]
MASADFNVTIASRALGWPVQTAFITAHEGTGIGLGGGSGDGVSLGKGLGEGVGVRLATSEGLGVGRTAVGALPQAASTRTAASAPTPSLTEGYNESSPEHVTNTSGNLDGPLPPNGTRPH